MTVTEWIRMAWRSLLANRLRAVLTTLGIIIGVSAVITLVSVAQGAARTVSAVFEGMGSHLIMIQPRRAQGGYLTLEDARELEARVTSIDHAVPSVRFSARLKRGPNTYSAPVEGVGVGFPEVRDMLVERGRFLTQQEIDTRARVAVLGPTVARELFGQADPLGMTIQIRGLPFTVIGITREKGWVMGRDADDAVFMPVTTAQRLAGTSQVGTIYARALSTEDARLAVLHITTLFERKFQRPDTVNVTSQDDILAAVAETTLIFSIMLGAVAGISLIVGGIGIMNIMLVSVSERKREIGVRKAIGARQKDIMGQFLVESTVLSAGGGILGAALGVVGSTAITSAAGWDASVSPGAILLAFTFACGVGLFFGVYPARRAASLDPIEALRQE